LVSTALRVDPLLTLACGRAIPPQHWWASHQCHQARGSIEAFTGKRGLRDLINGGLVDAQWPGKYPPEFGDRLQHLLDTPEG
jgi:hypothetical protein